MKFCIALVATLIFLSGCDVNRVYEKNKDLAERIWLEDSVVTFDVQLNDASVPYNIYANVRNGSGYPYYNLYVQYAIVDSSGREVERSLENLILFEPKTGEPFGSGLGDVFDHQIPVLTNYYFPNEGTYSVRMRQYMRRDTLEQLHSVGVRVELAGGIN